MYKEISKLIQNNDRTIYRWKSEKRPIISLLEKYFTKEDLKEFLETAKIQKFERNEFIYSELIKFSSDKYISTFSNNSLRKAKDYFVEFYFSFLYEIKKSIDNHEDVCDRLLFHSSFYVYDFKLLLNMFLASYSYNYISSYSLKSSNYKNIFLGKFYSLQIKIKIFTKWDNYMSIFLKECIESNFTILYKKSNNEEILHESMYHILGFYVFSNFTDISDAKKMEKLKNLFKIYKSFTIEEKKSYNADKILNLIFTIQNS